MKQAIFIERDGILNLTVPGSTGAGSPLKVADFVINPEAPGLVRQLKSAGFLVLATTNQPGLSRGTLARWEFDAMHAALSAAMPLDDILVCPHEADDECPCRRPKPGLLLEAAFKWHLDLGRSYVISDKWQDAGAAHEANCTSLLLRSPQNGKSHRDVVRDSLAAIVETILQQRTVRRARFG